MDLTTTAGNIADHEADAIIVNLFAGTEAPGGATAAVDQRLNGAIAALIEAGDFSGKLNDIAVLYPRDALPARRVIVVGLGDQADFTLDRARRATAAAFARAQALGASTIATIIHGAGAGGFEPRTAARAVAEGVILGLYTFDTYKTRAATQEVVRATLVEFEAEKLTEVAAGAAEGELIAECTNFARDMVNEPPNECNPRFLATKAEQIAAAFGLNCKVIDLAEMRNLGMGALLSVAQGSDEPPAFIVLEHAPRPLEENPPLVLVGKAITFDTGGYSLKSMESMASMKSDMAGGAAVLGAMRAAAMLEIPFPVVGLVPASENMVSGRATRPSDVVRASNGKTIEVTNTDAEGRLILADALVYATRYKPVAVIDLATLTGAAVVALGRGGAAGLFATDESLAERILSAGTASGERVWRLPLFEEYAEWMRRSEVADLRNSHGDRYAGVGTSAAFLREFAEGYPWAHIDIAPMAYLPKGKVVQPIGAYGATGYGVRLLSHMMLHWE